MTSAFEPRNLAEAVAMRLVSRADELYLAGNWAAALALYRRTIDSQPDIARQLALALPAGHCDIELAGAEALTAPRPAYGPVAGVPREAAFARDLRVRALGYCRAGDVVRASALLRFIAPVDAPTGFAYADDRLSRRSDCGRFLDTPADGPPAFFTDHAIDRLPVDTLKARHEGKRVLVVRRFGVARRRYGAFENLAEAAVRFGLTIHEITNTPLPGPATDNYVAALAKTIDDVQPQVILWDELFHLGVSAEPGHRDAIAELLEAMRRTRGIRVVNFHPDVYYVPIPTLFGGLGRCFDLISHMHPAILDRGTEAEKAAVFCCPIPALIESPTVAAGTVPRAAFAGAIHTFSWPRVVWWAECVRAGLPLDFIETVHDSPQQLSDVDYFNVMRRYQLSVNFNLRDGGARIFTGRAVDVGLAGGVLLDERSADLPYFLTPGLHYVPFETLPDLAAAIDVMLADAPRRQRMAAAAQAWCERYFTGDYYWSGVLSKLFP